ncbi:AraC family transcriptional regulator [Halodesulfovibrio marinisediminis]|uniref:AraC family transcriptional regulator n=1 Tax=Halodesulfovibrio marinisediminis DSM 17456 TaxID=1121457 RepID=A0A1N6DKC2_9BACT|nr:AraC family transcriptional regulator [Halodesulfovibrio marinisediminis]SIN71279.1 AraC family transcriptional regulator [Halodesulfovibrio marinisediminis DSM 17456]
MNAHDRIRRALDYIEQHLDESISLAMLAEQSMYAPHHFHHVFRGIIGEGVAEYQRRLKLQRAASALLYSNRQIINIALQAGYNSQEAFTRAFKRWCGYTPKYYRKWAPKHELLSGEMLMNTKHSLLEKHNLTVEVRTLPTMHVASVRYTGDYNGCGQAHEELCVWADKHNLFNTPSQLLGLCYDDPKATPAEKCRYDACIVIPESLDITNGPEKREIAGGRYATIIHKGSYETLYITYAALFGEWLPQSGEELLETPSIQVYLNNIDDTPPDELRTEIRVALK